MGDEGHEHIVELIRESIRDSERRVTDRINELAVAIGSLQREHGELRERFGRLDERQTAQNAVNAKLQHEIDLSHAKARTVGDVAGAEMKTARERLDGIDRAFTRDHVILGIMAGVMVLIGTYLLTETMKTFSGPVRPIQNVRTP